MRLENLRTFAEVSEQHKLHMVDIISPYLSEGFFDKLMSLKPKRYVCITTDAGCSSKIIKKIEDGKRIRIKPAHCQGIVHAKCYLFYWTHEKEESKWLFLWGSCNATDGGFERNAEVFSWLLLSKIDKEQRDKILQYFHELRTNKDNVNSVEIVHTGLTIKLPDISFCNKKDTSTFDIWIQKGRLCHPFPKVQNFRHLRVELKNKISPQDELSDALKQHNIGINKQTTITYDYLRHNTDEVKNVKTDDDKRTKIWKARYFVDTVHGFWTSEHCFDANESNFHKSDIARREKEIGLISNDEPCQRKEWNEGFLEILESINDAIPNPSEYFHYKDGMLDIEKYEKQFENQLLRDYRYANDSWFKRGYISGYNFTEVPQMRDSSNWDEFIKSFLGSLYFEINKSGSKSLLAKTIREDIGKVDSKILLEELKTNWNNHKEQIECFYKKIK